MTIRLLLILSFLVSITVVGQPLPDSIVIIKNTYVNSFMDGDYFYKTEKKSIFQKDKHYFLNDTRISKSIIINLISALKNSNNLNNSLEKYQVDTNWIKQNPNKLLLFYPDKKRLEWNEEQKMFIFKELVDLHNYNVELNDYLSSGCCYTLHNNYKNEFIIKFFYKGASIDEIKSRRHVWGYKMPWVNQSGDLLYNYEIEKNILKIIGIKEKTKPPLKSNQLIKFLANKIIDNNMWTLYKLSAYSYKKEIDELNTDFKVVSFEEVYGRGRYIWDEPKAFKIVLKNQMMLENVNMVFIASKRGKTIYTRDSIKRAYKNFIERVQSIQFITNYLETKPNSKLDIYYFNNKGINEYNIENVNKNPATWARHDKWVETLKLIEKNYKNSTFDIQQSIKTSQKNDCGCNYRFERNYIEKAIFFEIIDENKNSSIWFLLPDDKVLLYLMQGEKVLNYNYSEFGNRTGIQYPCVLFDKEGNKLLK